MNLLYVRSSEFGLMLCYATNTEHKKVIDVFAEIPAEHKFSFPYEDGLYVPNFYNYACRALQSIIKSTNDKNIIAKAKGIRGLLSCVEEWDFSVSRSRVISDLQYANKYNQENTMYCEQLSRLALEDCDFLSAYRYMHRCLENSPWSKFDEVLSEADGSYLAEASSDVFDQVVNEICALLSDPGYRDVKIVVQIFLEYITKRLFGEKQYKRIVDIADLIPPEELKPCPALFELAYSYGETSKWDVARLLYEYLVQKEPRSSAAINNLGVLHEEKGDLLKAKEAYQKALEIDPKSELYKSNLKRIIELEKAAPTFLKEKYSTRKKVISIWRQRDIDDFVPNVPAQLSKVCGLSKTAAQTAFKELTANNYLILIKQKYHNYGIPTYRINPLIQSLLTNIEAEMERDEGIISLSAEISPDSLKRIGYGQELTEALRNKSSSAFVGFLQRDLREAAIAFLTKSYKTTLVISGSIIEALLLDRISSAGITRYKMEDGKSRSVPRMDLNDFLYVAKKEQIIDDQLYHLGHALRGFRNLIHPGIEQRKAAMQVTEQNARIAWDVARKLIMEL